MIFQLLKCSFADWGTKNLTAVISWIWLHIPSGCYFHSSHWMNSSLGTKREILVGMQLRKIGKEVDIILLLPFAVHNWSI